MTKLISDLAAEVHEVLFVVIHQLCDTNFSAFKYMQDKNKSDLVLA